MSDNAICDLTAVRAAVLEAIELQPGDDKPLGTTGVLGDAVKTEEASGEALARLQGKLKTSVETGDGPMIAKYSREIITAKKAVAEAVQLRQEIEGHHDRLQDARTARQKVALEDRCRAAAKILIEETKLASARYEKLKADGAAVLQELIDAQRSAIECQLTAVRAWALRAPRGNETPASPK